MSLANLIGTNLGKMIQKVTRLQGGGQALPGLLIEKIIPGYTEGMLAQLPEGVVIISGTNGKTTTTKIVVELLTSQGKKVLTNTTGSNLTRGIASSLINHAKISGRLDYDLAVLEVDEATIGQLVKIVRPRWLLALNVSRDQLDRFGEVDTIAGYIKSACAAASEGVVLNALDSHLRNIGQDLGDKIHYFGAATALAGYFPSDYELAAVKLPAQALPGANLEVELLDFHGRIATYCVEGIRYKASLQLDGQHNLLNAAGALALVHNLLPKAPIEPLVEALDKIETPFGRGQTFHTRQGAVELVLVKNPASFRQAIASYASSGRPLLIVINDRIADGRDTSWLWDVNFSELAAIDYLATSGSRAADMALRLSYEEIKVGLVEPDTMKALSLLMAVPSGQPRLIFATYTAMLGLHRHLNRKEK